MLPVLVSRACVCERRWPIVLGRVGIYTGVHGGARKFSLFLGIILVAVGIMRFLPVLGDITVSLLNVNQAVAIFNIVVGTVALLVARSSRPQGIA